MPASARPRREPDLDEGLGTGAGVRASRREEMAAQILEIGRAHLVEHGAAALSLRAVARDVGMVSSAVYRYVASRDDLLTLLVVDAYTELADTVDAALARVRGGGVERRVLALARAVRGWALAHPSRWALLYGSPVPGYQAPGEVTTEPGTRVMRLLVGLVDAGVASGEVATGAGRVPVSRALRCDLAAIRTELGVTHADEAVLGRAISLWTALLGAVSAEVFGQFGADTFSAPDQVFDHEIRLALVVLVGPVG
ncbi:MAG: WHG domain-containing protein [Lapillicoccus sp.]